MLFDGPTGSWGRWQRYKPAPGTAPTVMRFPSPRARRPRACTPQMGMDNMTMLRMFLGAAATSMVAMAGMQTLGVAKRDPKPPRSLGLGDAFGANIVGGALQGAAMTLGGACPGTVWSQVRPRAEPAQR